MRHIACLSVVTLKSKQHHTNTQTIKTNQNSSNTTRGKNIILKIHTASNTMIHTLLVFNLIDTHADSIQIILF